MAPTGWKGGLPTAEHLRAWHESVCGEPHRAGTDGDARMIQRLAGAFREMGLETNIEEIEVYLPHFVRAQLQVQDGDRVTALPLLEDQVASDASVAGVVPPAFNAYSASGDVRAQVVYANYGTKEDFEALDERGVSVRGKIVLARYGRNYRGYKAKYAEARGAAGVLIYTDPQDSGYAKGLPYPEGGYANASSIQRGSILTLDYPGDPLTPCEPAIDGATRLDPETVALPRIPVQPIGWGAAEAILARMRGEEVPTPWQGGLPFRYRLTGGPDLQVRLKVEQPRRLTRTANVTGTLRGATHPDETIIVGCHFDAWTFGAGDPHAGTIVLQEMARSFAEAARKGQRPARTIVFAHWCAEEYGIIGSTEWCEAHRDLLAGHGVAYINLDMAAMGPDFNSAAAPLLKEVIEDASRVVPQARGAEGETVHERWSQQAKGPAPFGDLGGGSDHVGFYCHLGIPACSLGAGGSRGVSYHSAYDTLAWYRQVVGEDYAPALMLARLGNVLLARLAHAPLLPYDLARPLADVAGHLDVLRGQPAQSGPGDIFEGLQRRAGELAERATAVQRDLRAAAAAGRLDEARLQRANESLLACERLWLEPQGLPGRSWYRNLYAAADPHSGYAAWMLPLLRAALEGAGPDVEAAVARYGQVLDRYAALLEAVATCVPAADDNR